MESLDQPTSVSLCVFFASNVSALIYLLDLLLNLMCARSPCDCGHPVERFDWRFGYLSRR